METDVNKILRGDHFPIYTYIESLRFTTKTNVMLYVNYTSIKKKSVKWLKTMNMKRGCGGESD